MRITNLTKYKKAVLTPAAQPCRYPCPMLGRQIKCLGFGCHQQQKRHASAPPPAGVRRRMERKRQKLVGRDKGSLTEQQTEGKQEQQRYK